MAYQLTPEMPVSALVFVLTISLAGYGVERYRRHGHSSELLAFVSLMLTVSAWELVAIGIEGATELPLKLFGYNLINAVVLPLMLYSFLWFALAYSGSGRWVNRWSVGIAVAQVGALGVALVLEPEFLYDVRGLGTQGPVTMQGVTVHEWVVLTRDIRPTFLLLQLYAYVVAIVSSVVLGRYLFRNRADLYTGQMLALAVGVGTPIFVNGLLFVGVLTPELNLTGMSFAISAVAFAVAVFRYRLLRIAPIGRRQVVETMPDPVVILDAQHRVADCNPAARKLVDAPRSWSGTPATEFFAPFGGQIERVLGAEETEAGISLDQNETERHFDPSVSPLRTDRGGTNAKLVVLRDVTEQEAQRRQLRHQNERLDQFASVVSHDLRNPLSVVRGRLEPFLSDIPAEHAEAIERNLGRMEAMIDDLLTMSRAGQTVEEPESVGLAAVADEAWGYIDSADAEFDLVVPSEVTVRADRDRLLHVFENLFRNALDHNDPPLTVRVGLPEADESVRGESGFFVSDDGSGIPEDERDDVFGHGYSTSRDGTGFGLSIVEDVAEAHGWSVSVTDGSEGGARFEVVGVEIDRTGPALHR